MTSAEVKRVSGEKVDSKGDEGLERGGVELVGAHGVVHASKIYYITLYRLKYGKS